jgi:predicted DNA-binding transcriptional regulator YafY
VQNQEVQNQEVQKDKNIKQPINKIKDINNGNIIDKIKYSIDNSATVDIAYKTLKGIDIFRNVSPKYTFIAKSTDNFILSVFDISINDYRFFIINRIVEYTIQTLNNNNLRNVPPT